MLLVFVAPPGLDFRSVDLWIYLRGNEGEEVILCSYLNAVAESPKREVQFPRGTPAAPPPSSRHDVEMRRSPATPHATAITKRPTNKTNTGQPPQFPTQAAKTPTDRASRHARESSRPRCHAALRSPPMSSELLARPAQNYWPVRPVLAPRPLSPVQTKSIPAPAASAVGCSGGTARGGIRTHTRKG